MSLLAYLAVAANSAQDDEPSAGSISLVSHTVKAAGVSGDTSDAINTAGASLLVIAVGRYQGGTGITVTDSKENTYEALNLYSLTGDQTARFYICKNPVVGTGHTFTVVGTDIYCSFAVAAFSNTNTTSNPDSQNGDTSTGGTSIQTGSVTPSANNSLILTSLAHHEETDSLMIDSGFTILDTTYLASGNHYGVSLAYKIQTTAVTENPTWSQDVSASLVTAIAVIKPA